ncbi:MAG: hypothetical protein CMH83_08665 [Nocardioides sp.]|nr:hypothetical protein [Nocardioides sp.]
MRFARAESARGRVGWWFTAAALLVVLVLLGLHLTRADDTYRVPSGADRSTQAGEQPRRADALRVVAELRAALRSGDAPRAQALAVPGSAAEGTLAAMARTARAAQLDRITLRYLDDDGVASDEGEWKATVAVGWRYRGFDRAPANTETALTFAPRTDGSIGVAAVGADDVRVPVWMSGPLRVRRTDEVLLLVSGGADEVTRYEGLADEAVVTVVRVVEGWDPRLVVEVPADRAGLERALDARPDDYEQIAAVTTSDDGTTTQTSSAHVLVNPEVMDPLGPVAQQVVVSHEAAHVALDGPTSQAPTWLVEGIADYVALRDSTLPLSRTAAQVAARVAADGLPDALPTQADFDTAAPHLGAAYEGAWLLCTVLADRLGEDELLELYVRASDGVSVARLLRGAGWSADGLLDRWRTELGQLAETVS